MGGFQDLDEFFDSSLRLPVGGTTYVVPSPDAATGLYAQRLFQIFVNARTDRKVAEEDLAKLQLEDGEERDLYMRLLGPVYQQMVDDGVQWEKLKFCGTTALMWVAVSLQAAEKFWERGGIPEAPTPNRQARRRAGKASGSKTSARGSTGGTTSRRTSNRVIKGEVESSPGTTS